MKIIKENRFLRFFPGFDLPKAGDYVARLSLVKPGTRLPRKLLKDDHILRILVLGDSTSCRHTFGKPERTFIGKMTWQDVGVPEYGHMDLSHLFTNEKIQVYHVAISGMRLAAPGSWTAEEVNGRIFLICGVEKKRKGFFKMINSWDEGWNKTSVSPWVVVYNEKK